MADDNNGLPKVEGLEAVIRASMDKGPEGEANTNVNPNPEEAGQLEDKELEGVLKTFTTPDGKIRTKDLLKSYKEIQGFTTKVSQENAELKKLMAELKEQVDLTRYSPPPQAAQPVTTDFTQLFMENPEKAIAMKVQEVATTRSIAEVLRHENENNQEEFPERMGYVRMLSEQPQYSHLAQSPEGVKKLFEIADKSRMSSLEKRARESLKVLFGGDVDIDKLRSIVTKPDNNNPQAKLPNLNAYMPDVNTSIRTGADADSHITDLQRAKQEAVKNKDPVAVAGLLLREALLK